MFDKFSYSDKMIKTDIMKPFVKMLTYVISLMASVKISFKCLKTSRIAFPAQQERAHCLIFVFKLVAISIATYIIESCYRTRSIS